MLKYLLFSLYQSGENDSTIIVTKAIVTFFKVFEHVHHDASNAIIFLQFDNIFLRGKFPYHLSGKGDFSSSYSKKLSSFFFFLIIIPFSSVKESFFISSLFHLLFQNKFFLLSRRFFHFFFLRFFTSLKSMVPLSARSLISDETAQSRNEGLFSYKGNQAAIQMRQFRFHRQLHRGWRGLLIVPICCLLHVLMFFLQRFLFGT